MITIWCLLYYFYRAGLKFNIYLKSRYKFEIINKINCHRRYMLCWWIYEFLLCYYVYLNKMRRIRRNFGSSVYGCVQKQPWIFCCQSWRLTMNAQDAGTSRTRCDAPASSEHRHLDNEYEFSKFSFDLSNDR